MKLFENDQKRTLYRKQGNLLVVISRHPYDVVGASTGRSWTSCMNVDTGRNKKYIAEDIKHGTLVAYLVKNTDKNINHPIARIRLMRYFREANPKDFIVLPDLMSYGTKHAKFESFVRNWCKKEFHRYSGNYFKTPVLSDKRENVHMQHPTSWTAYERFKSLESFYVYNPPKVPTLKIFDLKQQELVLSVPKETNLNWWIGYTKAFFNLMQRTAWKSNPKILKAYKENAPAGLWEHIYETHYNKDLVDLFVDALEKDDISIVDPMRWLHDSSTPLTDNQFSVFRTLEAYMLEYFDFNRLTDDQLKECHFVWANNKEDIQRYLRIGLKPKDYFLKNLKTCKGFEQDMLDLFGNAQDYLRCHYANDRVFFEMINFDRITPPPLEEIDRRNLWNKVKERVVQFLKIKIKEKKKLTWQERRAMVILHLKQLAENVRNAERILPDLSLPAEDQLLHF